MIELKCGCKIDDNGKFLIGKKCLNNKCNECISMKDIHPFGNKRFPI